MQPTKHECFVCRRTSEQVPLIALLFRDSQYWICPQDLPTLIHKPEKLSDKLSGAEEFGTGNGQSHAHG